MEKRGLTVVTGAARGIGRAAVERLARPGSTIVAIDRDGRAVENLAAEVSKASADVHALQADLTSEIEVGHVFRHIDGEYGPVAVLVNSAGITGETGLKAHEVRTKDFQTVYAVNLLAAFFLTRTVVPSMLARNYGRILHIASIAGKEGNAGMLPYSATKAGLIGLVKSAAKDYAQSNITINALAPAVIRTDLVDAMPDRQVKYMTDRIPAGRTGSLEEVAAMIEFIVSEECSFTTGFTFDLSGGRATY